MEIFVNCADHWFWITSFVRLRKKLCTAFSVMDKVELISGHIKLYNIWIFMLSVCNMYELKPIDQYAQCGEGNTTGCGVRECTEDVSPGSRGRRGNREFSGGESWRYSGAVVIMFKSLRRWVIDNIIFHITFINYNNDLK